MVRVIKCKNKECRRRIKKGDEAYYKSKILCRECDRRRRNGYQIRW